MPEGNILSGELVVMISFKNMSYGEEMFKVPIIINAV